MSIDDPIQTPRRSHAQRPVPEKVPHPLCECDNEWCHSELAIGMGLYKILVDRYSLADRRVCLVDPHHVAKGETVLEETAFYAVVVDPLR